MAIAVPSFENFTKTFSCRIGNRRALTSQKERIKNLSDQSRGGIEAVWIGGTLELMSPHVVFSRKNFAARVAPTHIFTRV